MSEQQHDDQLDVQAGDQLDQAPGDALDVPAGDALDAGDGETTGDQDTAPAFPDDVPPRRPGFDQDGNPLEAPAPQSDDPDAPGFVVQPNPYSPGYGITGKFPVVQDDEADAGAGDVDQETEDQ